MKQRQQCGATAITGGIGLLHERESQKDENLNRSRRKFALR
jgi:hypothetical protein